MRNAVRLVTCPLGCGWHLDLRDPVVVPRTEVDGLEMVFSVWGNVERVNLEIRRRPSSLSISAGVPGTVVYQCVHSCPAIMRVPDVFDRRVEEIWQASRYGRPRK